MPQRLPMERCFGPAPTRRTPTSSRSNRAHTDWIGATNTGESVKADKWLYLPPHTAVCTEAAEPMPANPAEFCTREETSGTAAARARRRRGPVLKTMRKLPRPVRPVAPVEAFKGLEVHVGYVNRRAGGMASRINAEHRRSNIAARTQRRRANTASWRCKA
eukprot:scaffold118821_cov75-Phaeocystis_antarctica.AAC.1